MDEMAKIDHTRTLALTWLTLAIVALLLLSTSLSGTQLREGEPFPGGAKESKLPTPIPETGTVEAKPATLLQGILALAFVVLSLYLLSQLRLRPDWRRFLRLALPLVLLFSLLLLIPQMSPPQTAPAQNEVPNPDPAAFQYLITPLEKPPAGLAWLLFLGLIVFACAFGYWRYFYRPNETGIEKRLQEEAEKAIKGIRSGRELKSVIIQCYMEMGQAVQAQRGIERQPAMTTREFESLLAGQGIPAAPLHQLTRLFEAFRYGKSQSDAEEESEALECLAAISASLQEGTRSKR